VAVDAAGNADATPDERVWSVNTAAADTTPPVVTLDAPADNATVAGGTALSATATDDVAVDHVDFLVNGTVVATDGSAPYGATWASTTVPDGTASLTALAVDTAGNATTSTARVVTVDNTAPETTIDSGPQGAQPSSAARFQFSADGPATFACSLDGAAYTDCSSPQSYDALSEGGHTFRVRARDDAGNVDASPASRTWTVDTVAPDTSITSGPTGAVNTRAASFAFTSPEATVGYECSLDGSAFTACVSPRQYSGLTDGPHTFRVQARDTAGNVDATPDQRTWTVDPVSFSDGFESAGFTNWSSVHTAIDGTALVQSSIVRSGSYAARISAPSSTSYAYLRKTLAASQTALSTSGDFDITVEGVSGQDVPIFKLYDAASTRVMYVYRRNASGRVYVVYGGTTYASTAKLALGTWASFTVKTVTAGAGASAVDVRMNGASIYSATGINLGTAGIRTIQVGNDKQLPFTLYADNIDARIPPP
jgi:hypothetical protein